MKIEAIPESQELALLEGMDDSLECNENPNLQEDECDLVDDDFFQNLMKKPQQEFSQFL